VTDPSTGQKLIVWFEPERVGDRDSWLARHPDTDPAATLNLQAQA
jgi:hypothetical protein